MFDDDDFGCIGGILRMLFLAWIFDWLQDNFGFGRGLSGCGCGVILVVLFLLMSCSICCRTNWLSSFALVP